jgi:hypothetical protein
MQLKYLTNFEFPQEIDLKSFLVIEKDNIAFELMTSGESAFDGWTGMSMMLKSLTIIRR